jgi:hypothetical protein
MGAATSLAVIGGLLFAEELLLLVPETNRQIELLV